MLFVRCCLSRVVCQVLFVTCCLSRVVCHVLFVTCCLSRVVCHVLFVTCCVSRVVCHVLFLTCCFSRVVCHKFFSYSTITHVMGYVISLLQLQTFLCLVYVILISFSEKDISVENTVAKILVQRSNLQRQKIDETFRSLYDVVRLFRQLLIFRVKFYFISEHYFVVL